MSNHAAIAGAGIAVAASAAHFILPSPPNAAQYDLKHRYMVGAGVVMGAAVIGTVVTKDKSFIAVGLAVIILSGVAYWAALQLEKRYA